MGATLAATAGQGIVNSIIDNVFDTASGKDANSQISQQERLMEKQGQLNKDYALWNMANVTKPTYAMEQKQWEKRFDMQNSEWERQWKMQNKYNSAAEQLKRAREAGINPLEVMGNIGGLPSANGNVGSPAVNGAAAQFAQAPSEPDVIQANMAEAQIQHMRSQNALLQKQVEEKTINNKSIAELNAGQVALTWATVENMGERTNLTRQDIKNGKALERKVNEESELLIKQNQAFWDDFWTKIYQMEAQTSLVKAEEQGQKTQNNIATIALKYAEQREQWAIRQMQANFGLTTEQAKQAIAMTKLYFQQAETESYRTDQEELKYRSDNYKWVQVGSWRVSLQGERVQAAYRDKNVILEADKAARDFDKVTKIYKASYWYGDYLTNKLAQFVPIFKKGEGVTQYGGEGVTPSYQGASPYE